MSKYSIEPEGFRTWFWPMWASSLDSPDGGTFKTYSDCHVTYEHPNGDATVWYTAPGDDHETILAYRPTGDE